MLRLLSPNRAIRSSLAGVDQRQTAAKDTKDTDRAGANVSFVSLARQERRGARSA
jgi:hypothetical protein